MVADFEIVSAVDESELTLPYVYERLIAVQRILEYLINRLDLEESNATIQN